MFVSDFIELPDPPAEVTERVAAHHWCQSDLHDEPAIDGVPLVPLPVVARSATLRDCIAMIDASGIDVVAVDELPLRVVDSRTVVRALACRASVDDPAVAFSRPPVRVGRTDQLVDVICNITAAGAQAAIVDDGNGSIAGVVRLADAIARITRGPQWIGALRLALHMDAPT